MKSKQTMELLLNIYLLIYILLYIIFMVIISFLHSSFSIISISAITIPCILIIIWSLFLLKRSANNYKKVKRKQKHILIMSIILPLVCLVLLSINEYNSNFNTEKWLSKPNDRVYMIDNLLDNHKLRGKTKTEVYKLLGSSDDKSNSKLIYFLGTERGLIKIDNEQLILYLNKEDKVTNYKVITN